MIEEAKNQLLQIKSNFRVSFILLPTQTNVYEQFYKKLAALSENAQNEFTYPSANIQVLPEFEVKNNRVKLFGPNAKVSESEKEFWRLNSQIKDQLRWETVARHILWAYQINEDTWEEYSLRNNAEIEDSYLAKSSSVHFTNEKSNEKCEIKFQNMLEICSNNQRQRHVTRTDFEKPPNWALHFGNTWRFPLHPQLPDYNLVLNKFKETMDSSKYAQVILIERLQIKRWYTGYQAHKKDFQERLKIDTEKFLFHGCPEASADLIIQSNHFNRSFVGKHGALYGSGVYFSSNACYSHSFATPNTKGERCMFLARVLVGKAITGTQSMVTAPDGYDSTTGDHHIWVTYHDDQAYAEYLITYK
ncbi:unnamed protein product [Didymodactylos carnosus]|nr:unnamed protein product [Didymodactylos carnosus]CAF3810867.1 unnamed protein product [Didymodactylos carnosus]